jgi:hypothetical protein
VVALYRGRPGYEIVIASYEGRHGMGVVMCRACGLSDWNNHCLSEAFGHPDDFVVASSVSLNGWQHCRRFYVL